MLDDFISSPKCENDKKAAFEQAMGKDMYAKAILDHLEDQYIEDIILDMEERSKQLNQIQSEHENPPNVTSDGCSEPNDEGYGSHCEEGTGEVESNDPSSKIHNLRIRTGSAYNRNCSCCNSR